MNIFTLERYKMSNVKISVRLNSLFFGGSLLIFTLFTPLSLSSQNVSMVFVKGGTFWQGSNEAPYSANERAHQTTVSSFYISKTEITQAQWQDVMGTNPSKFPGKDRPVEYVSWFDAVKFCNALSLKEGLIPAYKISDSKVEWDKTANGYRLPTEAEWEYAARGGPSGAITDGPLAKAPYSGSDTSAASVGWFDANSNKTTKPVAQKEPNALGLYDMSGNVWEWCWDWYGSYPKDPVTNPDGSENQTGQKVLRGGSWFTPEKLLRTTYRYWNIPTFKVNSVGFRIARNAEDKKQEEKKPEDKKNDDEFSLPGGLNLFEALSPLGKNH
ncbi:MAG: formylglycine-generating enzyme family protein [Treponema sp.]|nr:formylglycine-generating enzyme family protein [Treponema sp.]